MREFIYKVTGSISVRSDDLHEAEEYINKVRQRLDYLLGNTEVELVDEVETEQEDV